MKALAVVGPLLALAGASFAADPIRVATARRWVLGEFSPSTLSVEQQMQEMAFFIRAE